MAAAIPVLLKTWLCLAFVLTVMADVILGDDDAPQAASEKGDSSLPWSDFRLPKSLLPMKYIVKLHPNISKSTFRGRVTMRLQVMASTDLIVFHAHKLKLCVKNVQYCKDARIGVKKTGYIEKLEMFYIKLSRPLCVDTIVDVDMSFKGSISPEAVGLFKTTYSHQSSDNSDPTEQVNAAVATQMQPIYARRVFPCMDEPSFTAAFEISIIREKHYSSLSNTALVSTTDASASCHGCVMDKFAKTPDISPHLVAMVVFENKAKITEMSGDYPINVFETTPKLPGYRNNIVNTAVRVFNFVKNYLDISEPPFKYVSEDGFGPFAYLFRLYS
ncbi:aminopeptidase [Elysia marginata]|uniref:Aminopeptidase n=1 Tax=Elysia marginata TaxID=1093978 RepID=A0AAV4EIV5_9GAST|nr:aminopeptidase [Elysia marginata]